MKSLNAHTAKTAAGRPDTGEHAPSTLPSNLATDDRNARLEPAVQPRLHRDDPRPGDETDDLHVVPDDDGWSVKVAGEAKRVAVTPTKREALKSAKAVARERGMRLVIHKANGEIQRTINYA